MKYSSHGFTLLELMSVIILLGFITLVAMPKFFDLAADTRAAQTSSVAATLSAANALNYVLRKTDPKQSIDIAYCTQIAWLLKGGLPAGYLIMQKDVPAQATIACTLKGKGDTRAVFMATGTAY